MNKKDLKRLISNLPATPGVMGRERFFNSSVLIPFIKIDGKYFILFQKRAKHIRQGGDICFPGGGVEPEDKSFMHTALRETKEELGIKKKDIKILGQLDTMVTTFGAIVEPFVGLVKKKALKNMKVDSREVEKTLLIPLDFFKSNEPEIYNLRSEVKPFHIDEHGNKEVYLPSAQLGLAEAYHQPWGHKKHTIYVYKYEGEVIWGMTAVIIKDLLKKY